MFVRSSVSRRRWLRWVLGVAAVVLLAIATVELSFRLAGLLLAHDPAAPAGRAVVLCVGDSHTWGGGQGYPAKLGELLAERSARYAVVNLGVPGTNTAQVRSRLLRYFDLYQPRVLILWSGVNNSWNFAEREEVKGDEGPATLHSRLLAWLARSRTLRFIRAWREQGRIERLLGAGDAPLLYREQKDGEEQPLFRRRFADGEDVFATVLGEKLDDEDTARFTQEDVAWIAARARERGIAMIAVTYAFPGGSFAPASLGIERAAKAAGIPVVSSAEAVHRMVARYPARAAPDAFDRTAHPSRSLYDEVARMLLETIDREKLL